MGVRASRASDLPARRRVSSVEEVSDIAAFLAKAMFAMGPTREWFAGLY